MGVCLFGDVGMVDATAEQCKGVRERGEREYNSGEREETGQAPEKQRERGREREEEAGQTGSDKPKLRLHLAAPANFALVQADGRRPAPPDWSV